MTNFSNPGWSRFRALWLAVPPIAVAVAVGATLRHRDWNEPFFVYSAYYVLWAMLGTYLLVLVGGRRETGSVRAWVTDNAAGLLTTAIVSTIVIRGVAPAFRVLADEANLVGVSKNLFFNKTANFAVTGKWYFDNYWNINETTDRRPALYPFLVSLVHLVRGYRAENGFHANAIIFVLFVFTSYRLAKRLGGELFGVMAAVLVAASPNTMIAARSAGFDLLSVLLLLVVIRSFYDYVADPAPRALALLALSLCLLAHVRVEGLALVAVSGVVLLAVRVFRWSHLRGYGFVYSLAPVFLAARYWQSVAKANDAEQPISASLFGKSYLAHNLLDYARLATHPLVFDGPHPRLILIAGALGAGALLIRFARRGFARALQRDHVHLAVLVAALAGFETILCFSYMFGQTSQPASARLFIWLDTLFAFLAAWLVARLVSRAAANPVTQGRSAPVAGVMACAALLAMYIPVASEARFINALILTRQAAETWAFFDKLGEKRILVLTDRPGLFTIMDYGALDISLATADRNCLFELSRHLYKDIYLVQEMDLDTKQPLSGFAAWPDVATETEVEFQNTDSSYVRVSRVTP
jgi:4-amino-4-deoxy-L-arabinose transferase-like glycosyltransferase